MSRQVSRSSTGEYQADEQAGVARLGWRLSGMGKSVYFYKIKKHVKVKHYNLIKP